MRRLREIAPRRPEAVTNFILTFGKLRELMQERLRKTAEEERAAEELLHKLQQKHHEFKAKYKVGRPGRGVECC